MGNGRTIPYGDQLDRDTLPIDDEPRVYYSQTLKWMALSVSTITGVREDPEKEAILDNWRSSYDGSDDDSYPHYREQTVYKQLRGTLGHYAILSELGTVPKSDEEREAETVLKEWDERRPSATEDGVDHVGDDHAYNGEQAWSRCMRDLSWVTKEFYEHSDEWHISPETTIACEVYVAHDIESGEPSNERSETTSPDQPNYAGQFDLLYEHPEHGTTLCDLKLASGIRRDYKLQLAAYAQAIEQTDRDFDGRAVETVDRLQIIRLHPDSETIEVQTNDGTDAVYDGELSVEQQREAREDGRLIETEIKDFDAVEDHWAFDCTVELDGWDDTREELRTAFNELVENATDEWLTQYTFDEVMAMMEDE